MGGFLDRLRAGRLMEAQGLDAMLLIQPESIAYASGAFPGVASFWRRAGAAMILVPADEREPLAAVVGDLQVAEFRAASGIDDVRTHPIWVDAIDLSQADLDAVAIRAWLGGDVPDAPRPTTYNRDLALAALRDILAERRLAQARIGTEHAFLPLVDAAAFTHACPGIRWSDATGLVARLRAVKAPAEIEYLRLAGLSAEAGVRALTKALKPGVDARHLEAVWREAALAEAARLGAPGSVGAWAYIAVGPDGFAPGGPAQNGDLVKVDVGCVVRGYSSDGARTFVLGEPSAAAREIHTALLDAFEAGARALRPGYPLRDVHAAVMRSMREAGFNRYNRGHVGHGLGASVWSEEWPYIGADAEGTVEPGMVLAFETPWYIRGVGGFMIEDQFTIGGDAALPIWTLPRELARVE